MGIECADRHLIYQRGSLLVTGVSVAAEQSILGNLTDRAGSSPKSDRPSYRGWGESISRNCPIGTWSMYHAGAIGSEPFTFDWDDPNGAWKSRIISQYVWPVRNTHCLVHSIRVWITDVPCLYLLVLESTLRKSPFGARAVYKLSWFWMTANNISGALPSEV